MSAVLFGSISTIADTSEIQREAFNQAFREHGLDWSWSREEYRGLLQSNGGRDRIAEYARRRGEEVDADAVHETKSRIFQERLRGGVAARPGVADTIRGAREAGRRVGLITTTPRENVAALLDGVADVSPEDFDLITDRSTVEEPKPDGAVYAFALRELGEDAAGAVAIEDNVGGVAAAKAAGLRAVAFPNENTTGHDFSAADECAEALDPAHLTSPAA